MFEQLLALIVVWKVSAWIVPLGIVAFIALGIGGLFLYAWIHDGIIKLKRRWRRRRQEKINP